jgi:hypothetical protein
LAKIVALHGDVYLPLFQRIEEELKQSKAQDEVRLRALKLAYQMENDQAPLNSDKKRVHPD